LNKWAVEVAETGSFSAPLASGGPGGLPVPYLVIANKVDIVDGTRVRNGSVVDVVRQWIEKRGLLPCNEELPLTDSFPGKSALNSVRFLVEEFLLISCSTCNSFSLVEPLSFFILCCFSYFFLEHTCKCLSFRICIVSFMYFVSCIIAGCQRSKI
jgi:Rab-like protein 3